MTPIRRIHHEDTTYQVPRLHQITTTIQDTIEDQYVVSIISIRRIEDTDNEYSGSFQDIKCGPYSKKLPIRRIGGSRPLFQQLYKLITDSTFSVQNHIFETLTSEVDF